jgi:uncharacterized protein (TIGR03437 family)
MLKKLTGAAFTLMLVTLAPSSFGQTSFMITTTSVPNGVVGQGYNAPINANGVAGTTWFLESGSLPPGLALGPGPSMNTAITGTPTQVGTYAFQVGAQDDDQDFGDAFATFSITISSPFNITTTSLPSGNVGQPYSATLSTSNGSSSTEWTLGCPSVRSPSRSVSPRGTPCAAPPWLSIGRTGSSTTLSGTPTSSGTFDFEVQAFDPQQEAFSDRGFSLTINNFAIQSQSPLPGGIVGQGYDVSLSLVGGTPPFLFTIAAGSSQTGQNGFPPGLSISSSGEITGDPTAAGTYFFTLNATDFRGNQASMAFTLTVAPTLSITTLSIPSGVVGAPYPQTTIAATGGFPPFTFFINGTPPPGMSLSTSGNLTGTPTAAGTYPILVEVTDTQNNGASKQFQLTVASATPLLEVSPAKLVFSAFTGGDTTSAQTVTILSTGTAPVNYAVTVDAGTTGSAAPVWISVSPLSGATPGALTVTGTPGSLPAGTYPATIHITVPGNPGQASIDIPVTFTITSVNSQLSVSPASLNLGASVQTPSVQTQTVVIRNSGGAGTLSYNATVVGQSSWITSVTPASGQTSPNVPVLVKVVINSQGLANGNFHDILRITWSGGVTDVPIVLFVSKQGAIMSVDVTGLLFEQRQGNGNGQTQTVHVIDLGNQSSTLNWTASVISGADWASVGNITGTSNPGAHGSFTVTVGGDAGTLPVGGAYALIKISDANTANPSLNSPQYVVAVLSTEAATNPPEPHPTPAGFFFNNSSSGTVTVNTSSNTPAMFQASASTVSGGNWLTVTPTTGIASTQTPGITSAAVNISGLANGIYYGSINISMNGMVRSVTVTLVVTGQTTTPPSPESPHAASCTPAHLALSQTALSSNFSIPAGWPATLIVQLNDDCGNPVSGGSVVASFSNGDPPLTLAGDQISNLYSATWQPSSVVPSMTVTMHGASGALQPATVVFPGAVEQNMFAPPTLIPGGTLHIFFNLPTAEALGNGLAPGNVGQVFGTNMASVAQAPGVVPLLNQFSGTFMLIGAIQVPLYFVSPGQLDIQVPAELVSNQQYTAIVSANGALSLPELLNIVPEQPGVAANADGTVIAQHAVDYSLVTAAHPAAPGEPLIIYLAGLGATNPTVADGMPTPNQLVPCVVQPTVTVDNQPAVIAYAGLTPGGIGLYQINFTVPSNANSGNLSLVVTQAGLPSNTATLPVN